MGRCSAKRRIADQSYAFLQLLEDTETIIPLIQFYTLADFGTALGVRHPRIENVHVRKEEI